MDASIDINATVFALPSSPQRYVSSDLGSSSGGTGPSPTSANTSGEWLQAQDLIDNPYDERNPWAVDYDTSDMRCHLSRQSISPLNRSYAPYVDSNLGGSSGPRNLLSLSPVRKGVPRSIFATTTGVVDSEVAMNSANASQNTSFDGVSKGGAQSSSSPSSSLPRIQQSILNRLNLPNASKNALGTNASEYRASQDSECVEPEWFHSFSDWINALEAPEGGSGGSGSSGATSTVMNPNSDPLRNQPLVTDHTALTKKTSLLDLAKYGASQQHHQHHANHHAHRAAVEQNSQQNVTGLEPHLTIDTANLQDPVRLYSDEITGAKESRNIMYTNVKPEGPSRKRSFILGNSGFTNEEMNTPLALAAEEMGGRGDAATVATAAAAAVAAAAAGMVAPFERLVSSPSGAHDDGSGSSNNGSPLRSKFAGYEMCREPSMLSGQPSLQWPSGFAPQQPVQHYSEQQQQQIEHSRSAMPVQFHLGGDPPSFATSHQLNGEQQQQQQQQQQLHHQPTQQIQQSRLPDWIRQRPQQFAQSQYMAMPVPYNRQQLIQAQMEVMYHRETVSRMESLLAETSGGLEYPYQDQKNTLGPQQQPQQRPTVYEQNGGNTAASYQHDLQDGAHFNGEVNNKSPGESIAEGSVSSSASSSWADLLRRSKIPDEMTSPPSGTSPTGVAPPQSLLAPGMTAGFGTHPQVVAGGLAGSGAMQQQPQQPQQRDVVAPRRSFTDISAAAATTNFSMVNASGFGVVNDGDSDATISGGGLAVNAGWVKRKVGGLIAGGGTFSHTSGQLKAMPVQPSVAGMSVGLPPGHPQQQQHGGHVVHHQGNYHVHQQHQQHYHQQQQGGHGPHQQQQQQHPNHNHHQHHHHAQIQNRRVSAPAKNNSNNYMYAGHREAGFGVHGYANGSNNNNGAVVNNNNINNNGNPGNNNAMMGHHVGGMVQYGGSIKPIKTKDPLKPGDWICPNLTCRYHNFARRVTCVVCGTSDSRAGRI